MRPENQTIASLLEKDEDEISRQWIDEYHTLAEGRASGASLAVESRALFAALKEGIRQDGTAESFNGPAWNVLRDRLAELSSTRAALGESSAVTSGFILAIKRPLFQALQRTGIDPDAKIAAIWAFSSLADRMAQWTVSIYQRTREEIIARQQNEIFELSTPVIKLWAGVLAVPLIGTLDSSRSQIVMENLLQRIVDTGSSVAIIDITGVPTVDTLVAQHLIKTVTAIRLMGAESIISGIRPQIAQTIVHLGIDLQGIVTRASLADALVEAIRMVGDSHPGGAA
ncbi:STAS domain-containing protein [Pigmentiphaga soli]